MHGRSPFQLVQIYFFCMAVRKVCSTFAYVKFTVEWP